MTHAPIESNLTQNQVMRTWTDSTVKVSVIIHAFNHERYIRQAILSVLSQKTSFAFELIVNDDASTDSTPGIIEEFAARFPGIVKPIYHKENQYSKGIRPTSFTYKTAIGEYIALCEGDDYWIDNMKLQRQFNSLSENPDVNLCVHSAYQADNKSERIKPRWYFRKDGHIESVSTIFSCRAQFAPTASYFFRSKCLVEFPDWFFQGRRLPFGDFFIEAIVGFNGIVCLSPYMSVYRRGSIGSHTSSMRRRTYQEYIDTLENSLAMVDELALVKPFKKQDLDQRKSLIALDYCYYALDSKNRNLLKLAILKLGKDIKGIKFALTLIGRTKPLFQVSCAAYSLIKRVRW